MTDAAIPRSGADTGDTRIDTKDWTEGERHRQLLAAVADPVRLRALAALREPLAVGELCERLEMAQPRVSHHLSVLRACGLVEADVAGRRRVHRWARTSPGSPERDLQDLLERWWSGESPPAREARGSTARPGPSSRGAEADASGPTRSPAIPTSTDLDDFLL